MEVKELESLAGDGGEMPEGLDSAQQMYFQALSYLYARYRAGDITKEEGAIYKARMRAAYDKAAFELSMWSDHAKKLADLAGPASEFRKHPNLESAQRIIDILYHGVKGVVRYAGV